MDQKNTANSKKSRSSRATIRRNGLEIECFFSENGRLQKKIEAWGENSTEFTYQFDDEGHLLKVMRNGVFTEKYKYNQRGQRIEQQREARGLTGAATGYLCYDEQGKLSKAEKTSFYYDKKGALAERCDCQGVTKYTYGKDTLLDRVILPSHVDIRYECDKSNPFSPVRRFRQGCLTTEYVWRDPIRLSAYIDHDHQLEYSFVYDSSGVLDTVRILPMPPERVLKPDLNTDWAAASSDWLDDMVAHRRAGRIHALLGKDGRALDLHCGTDQVGTLKILTDKSGKLVKEVQRDSFGILLFDSQPDLFMPIGFAGGLEDPDTGFVRFGYRDYDPAIGRFTAPDPLGDTGGDHDSYDYCIDDPVTLNDPEGLFPPALLLAGIAGSLGLGLSGSYGAAKIVDKIKTARAGEESTTARDAIKKVAPHVVNIHTNAFLPGQVWLGAATTGVGSVLGIKAALEFIKHGRSDSRRDED